MFRPQTRATGNLPHISHILCKPELLGTEFKVLVDAQTNILLHLEQELIDIAKANLSASMTTPAMRIYPAPHIWNASSYLHATTIQRLGSTTRCSTTIQQT